MTNLVSVLGLEPLLTDAGIECRDGQNFELIYDMLSSDDAHRDIRLKVDTLVRQYFVSLQLPDEVTLYDQLLLTLRPKDLIATFNWDPFLLQAYARNRDVPLPRVTFLHGNVYVGFCPKHRANGYASQNCDTCG